MAETAEPEAKSTRTSPTTNDELGVLGASLAKAEETRLKRMASEMPAEEAPAMNAPAYSYADDPNFRLEVLRLAQQAYAGDTVTAEAVVQRGTAYLAFIKGDNDGRIG